MNQEIVNAIQNRVTLAFGYPGQDGAPVERVVVPYTYGVHRNGHTLLVGKQITRGGDGEVQSPVPTELREHVVEESNPGLHVRVAPAVEVDPNSKIGLVGLAGDFGDPGHRLRVRGKR